MATRRKLISSSSSICKVGDDEDLLVEILIRLPGPRSAFRCKSVCKRWNSLISGPYFPRRFVSHRQTLSASTGESEPPVLTLSQVRELILSFLPFPRELRSKFSVLDCDRDLLLLGFRREDKNDQELRRTHLICNPLTKQWVALPLSQKMSVRNNCWIVKLVSQPFNPHSLDLGAAEGPEGFTGRFRVVRMYVPSNPGTVKVNVYLYCSISGEWTHLVLRLDPNLRCHSEHRMVSHGGKLYWFNCRLQVVKWDPFCVDYGTLPTLMDVYKPAHNVSGPWISEGHLHGTSGVISGHRIAWRLEGGGWRKLYDYEGMPWKNLRRIRKIRDDCCEIEKLRFDVARLIDFHREKSEVVFLSVYDPDREQFVILSCDLKKQELEFVTYEERGDDKIFQPIFTLWPSFIPSHGKSGKIYDGSYSCWLPSNDSQSAS